MVQANPTGADSLHHGSAPPTRQRFFYGWYVVIAAMAIAAVTVGARNGFGVFVLPMSEHFGWSRTEISVAAAMGWLVNGITQPFLGQLFDKFNSRKVILISLFIAGLTTAALSLTFHYLFLVFVFSFVLSTAMSGASIGTLGPLVARWFQRRRTLVLGLVAAGTSLGGMALIPLSGFLAEYYGWRVSWGVLGGVVMFVALPLGFVFLRNNPAQMGLLPDGAVASDSRAGGGTPERRRGLFEVEQWYESFRFPPIWNLSAAYTVCGITVGLISVHFVPYATEQAGISLTMASTIFGVLTGLNVIGAIGGGWLADRFRRKNVLGTVYSVRAIAYLVLIGGLIASERSISLPLIGSPTVPSLWIFAVLAGFSWIASVPITTSLTADVYGLRALGAINGISFLCHQLGATASIILGGVLYQVTGSYLLPFAIAAASLVPAAIASYTINEGKYSSRYQVTQAPAAGAASGD